MKKPDAGLYLHIPFCAQKCEYCDFYSITQVDQTGAFVQALLKEMELAAPHYRQIYFRTVFLGGGTPSLLSEGQLGRIVEALRRHFAIRPDAEMSIESNPGTLSANKLRFFRQIGFNRLSMGVQSFNPEELRFLGRIHSVEEVLENFRHAREAGFTNINIDLMTAFPGITRKSFRYSLQQAIALLPEHISCYTLIFEPGTVFYKRMLRGEMHPLAESEEAQYYELAAAYLERHGYQQYEISNFSRGERFRCAHNLIYWKHQPYLGLGPSAHSFFDNRRFANRRSLRAYLAELKAGRLPRDFEEVLSPRELMFEHIFLGLRMKEGLDLAQFYRTFGIDFAREYHSVISRLADDKLVEQQGETLRLSARGWLLADSVAAQF